MQLIYNANLDIEISDLVALENKLNEQVDASNLPNLYISSEGYVTFSKPEADSKVLVVPITIATEDLELQLKEFYDIGNDYSSLAFGSSHPVIACGKAFKETPITPVIKILSRDALTGVAVLSLTFDNKLSELCENIAAKAGLFGVYEAFPFLKNYKIRLSRTYVSRKDIYINILNQLIY